MVVEAGPKIMDFGVANLEAGELTAGNRVFGSPSYMSPEQALGQKVDGRSDLFSLGAVLFELLTGAKAFPGPGEKGGCLGNDDRPSLGAGQLFSEVRFTSFSTV